MNDLLKSKVTRLLEGEGLIFSNDEFNELIGYRVTNYIRSASHRTDTWKCWIKSDSRAKALADAPFNKE